uniref:EOG090X0EO1 n=1 Tax=Scapholeberis mucronata TaxID=202097 RepID=A0A4Y7NL41_9CRUS|nr:EOG090X0EO1 [Scapholeberis mucronata]SVE93912.1 EOG090X0EO1 [Scapholeberis mucronata]
MRGLNKALTIARSVRTRIMVISIQVVSGIQGSNDTTCRFQDILELTAKYRSESKHLKKLIEEFEKLAKEDDDREWSEDVNLFRTQLTSNQVSFRNASNHCLFTLNTKNKNELFYSNPAEPEVRSRKNKSQEELMKMSTNVTGNLHNICQSMANVLEQNRSTLEVLAQSSNTVTDTQDEYKVMGSTLNSTKKLIARYGRKEMTNFVLFLLAVLAFFATCLYVIVQRR